MDGGRRGFLAFVLAAVAVCWSGIAAAQNTTPAASGDTVQLTLDVQGMH